MKRTLGWIVLLLLPLAAGCSHDCYEVDITPDGDAFQRRVTCWNETHRTDDLGNPQVRIAPLDPEQLAHLKKLYGGRQTPDDAAKHVFAGRFEGDTPEDVGGAGSLTRFTCPLGETTIYVEQFRGDDDLYGQLTKRQEAVDQLVEIVVGWLEQEMGDSPEFPRLKRFCVEELRRDVKNAMLYAWIGDVAATESENVKDEFLMRMLLYFSRRGYIQPKEVSQLKRAATELQPEYTARLAQRVIARKIGVPDDQPVPQSLAFLADLERLESSLDEYIGTTELYRQRLAQWKKQNPDTPEEQTLKPLDALGQTVLEDLLGLQLMAATDKLSVRLASGGEPVATNGEWDADTGKVTWSEKLTTGRSLAMFFYAIWAKPIAEAQTPLFGKVILDGDNLIDYVLWYEGLTQPERETWDAFVDGCRPGEGLTERVAGFRFPGEPKRRPDAPDGEASPSLADPAKTAILDGLGVSLPDPERGVSPGAGDAISDAPAPRAPASRRGLDPPAPVP